jgi:hypothetical protein
VYTPIHKQGVWETDPEGKPRFADRVRKYQVRRGIGRQARNVSIVRPIHNILDGTAWTAPSTTDENGEVEVGTAQVGPGIRESAIIFACILPAGLANLAQIIELLGDTSGFPEGVYQRDAASQNDERNKEEDPADAPTPSRL